MGRSPQGQFTSDGIGDGSLRVSQWGSGLNWIYSLAMTGRIAAEAVLQRNPPNGGFTGRFKDVKIIRWSVRPAPWVQVVQYKMVYQAQGVTWFLQALQRGG
jgi:hypothetical protein